MKGMVYCLYVVLLFMTACNFKTSNNTPEREGEQSDGLEIRQQPFSNSNQIEYEISVVKGTTIKHGVQKRYYLHGSLYSTIPYIAGEKQGIAYTYYKAALNHEPQVWKEQPYEKNELNGTCKRYHRDGTLQAEYEYKNGLRAVGLKEYSESGKEIGQPELLLSKHRVPVGYLIQARLSDGYNNVNYFIGDLVEGKYLPKNMKGLQTRNEVGEIVLSQTTGTVTITAEYSTRYQNRGVVSATINL